MAGKRGRRGARAWQVEDRGERAGRELLTRAATVQAGLRRLLRSSWLLGLLLLLIAVPAAAQTLPDLPPVGTGVYLVGGIADAPVEVGGVRHFSWYSASVSLMPGGESDPTRVVLAAGPHLTQGPVRLYGRIGGGYEWAGSEGRPVVRLTYGGELALTETILLVLQGATSVASGSSGWVRSPESQLTLGIQLLFGPSASQLQRDELQHAHPDWPPELVELVAQEVVPEELAQAHHPAWSVDELRLVSQGRVAPGMTPEMVAAALGQPDEILEVTDPGLGPILLWRYSETVGRYDAFTGKPSYRQEVRRTIVFRDGVVARVE